ncbi:hypothetical protein [Thiobacillus sp.]|uniref:hypothetical protein n=1 Tax=Thiobacillus sp. TaxID=924 RepID=UPI00286E70D1|nr:hypothetical protein [Thiobacillus sp.]
MNLIVEWNNIMLEAISAVGNQAADDVLAFRHVGNANRARSMIIQQCEIGKPCNRCAARMPEFIGLVLLLGLLTVLFASFAYSSGSDTCVEGYIWREAYPGDHVCVAPEVRNQTAADNKLAAMRREPQGGAYGPDTCKPGFVWREARPEDHVCVLPEVRAQTARDNSLAYTRRLMPPAAANGGGPRHAEVWSAAKPAASPPAPMALPKMSKPAPGAMPAPAPAPRETATMSFSFRLPEFPWPPPPFSTRLKLDRGLLVAGQTTPTNGSVAARMELALAANGYTQLSYYAVPDGFAIVTQIERIAPDAAPAAEQRWSTEVPPVIPFNLDAYIKALLGKNGDSFRVIAFAFTPTPFTTSGKAATPGEAMAWVEKGATALPAALAAQAYGKDTVCTALVYEFRISSLGAAAKRPGAFSAKQHLRAAGILKALEPQP